MSFNNKTIYIIIFFALLIRVLGLGTMPPSLNWDEVSHGYNAYSLLESGHDEWGNSFPTIFRAYGDYKLPVYIYLTAISQFIFGLGEFSVRFPSAIAGVGVVLFTYLLSRKLFNNHSIAVISSLLVAVEPWSFFTSRVALEANVALLLIIAGVYCLFSLQRDKRLLIVGLLLFGLSVWTYNSARIFTPLLLLSISIFQYKEIVKAIKDKFILTSSILIIMFFFFGMVVQLLSPTGQARYENVQILDQGAIASIEQSRNSSNLPEPLPRLLHNKPLYFIREFSANYISHFLPSYLFINGGSDYQFNIPNQGVLYLVTLPVFYLGLFLAIRNSKDKSYRFLLLWLLLAPVASSATRESPHVLRSLVMLPVPMLLSAIAVVKKPRITAIYILLIFISFIGYLFSYYGNYRSEYSWSWQYGYKQVVSYTKANYDKYDNIIVTKKYGEPHEFFLYYWPWSPSQLSNDPNLVRYFQSNWYWVDRFDKFYFVNDWEIPQYGQIFITERDFEVNCIKRKCLLVTTPSNRPLGWKNVETIAFLNGEIAFEIYENK